MPIKDDVSVIKDSNGGSGDFELIDGRNVVRNVGSKAGPDDDPSAPSEYVGSHRQRVSDLWTILCSGCALISDGYANSLMTLINVILRVQYKKEYTSDVSTRVSNALLVGEILGQITIGLTCDYLGRKFAIILTSSMIILGLALSAGSSGTTIAGMFWMLTVSRGITGFGTGGEYPASSTSASEAANAYSLKQRGTTFVLVTNLPLSFGVPLASSIFLIVYSAAGGMNHPSTVWRVCFGIGIIFPLSIFYWRVRMLNSTLYRRGAIRQQVPYLLVARYYWKSLIGTCGAWFLYDFVTIPNAVFSGSIISKLVPDKSIKATAEWQLLLGTIALPGVILGALLVDKLARKTLMMIGFGGFLTLGLVLGCAYDEISTILPLFVVLYGVLLSFGNFGPGNMVGLVSSESYATAVRGTCYGLSAAFGKAGAAVGTQAFLPIENNLGVRWTFIIAAIIGLCGIIVTWIFVPNLTGDDLAIEDEKFRAYLVRKGWKGMMGDEDLKDYAEVGIPRGIAERESLDT
jgi:MFS family permease